MRPIRLEIRGFTAFREPQVVDFDGLDLFAITGPTGSGKSSILDALTFALYGRAERVGDGVRQLVSQGQPRAAVVLEFEAGGERYRVARSVTADAQDEDPASSAPTRRPSRAGARPATAPTGSATPTRTLERLVGLDYAGFTRAVLLPQGRFAEFLAGDAKTRREILADLLDLGLFERIAAAVGRAGPGARRRGHRPGRHPRGGVRRRHARRSRGGPPGARRGRRSRRPAGHRPRRGRRAGGAIGGARA